MTESHFPLKNITLASGWKIDSLGAKWKNKKTSEEDTGVQTKFLETVKSGLIWGIT